MRRARYSLRSLFVLLAIVASFFGGLQVRRTMYDALRADLLRADTKADLAELKRLKAEMLLGSLELRVQLEDAGDARRRKVGAVGTFQPSERDE